MARLLYGIAVVLVAIWLFGFVIAHVVSPLIHLVLVIAVIAVIAESRTGSPQRMAPAATGPWPARAWLRTLRRSTSSRW